MRALDKARLRIRSLFRRRKVAANWKTNFAFISTSWSKRTSPREWSRVKPESWRYAKWEALTSLRRSVAICAV